MPKPTLKSKAQIDRTQWDTKFPQLGKRTRGDRETWIVSCIGDDGARKRRTLGLVSEVTLEAARAQAMVLLVDGVEDDLDAAHTTVAELHEIYMADRKPEWALTTYRGRRSLVAKLITPQLGDIRVAELNGVDVNSWLAGLERNPGTCNIALAHLSGMMRHAEILGLRAPGSNPCKGRRKRKSGFKAKYLTDTEFRRFGKTLREFETEHKTLVTFLRFLAVTGARLNEVRSLRWNDLETDRIPLPNSKTGPRTIWLGRAARDVLSGLDRDGPYVFQKNGVPIGESALRKDWALICKRARLKKFRMHDLRHNFASVGITRGESLRTVGGLLGHTRLDATQGYAHLAEKALKVSARQVANDLNRKLGLHRRRKPRAKVVSPLEAKEFEIVKIFLRQKGTLPEFCAFNNLNQENFHSQVLEYRKLKQELSA